MPRYFFHVIDGIEARDLEGTQLLGLHVARAEAIRMAGEVLRDMGGRSWDGSEWRLEVEDEQGRVLFVLRFSAEGAPLEVGLEGHPASDLQPSPAEP